MTEPHAPQNVTLPMAGIDDFAASDGRSNTDPADEIVPPRAIPPAIRRLGWLLDEAVPVPGTRYRFGLDFVLGLIPGVGDVTGMILGLPILATGIKRRLGWRTILMMSFNVLVDAVGGFVPVLGNIFDFLWKGHAKNLQLLENPQAVAEMVKEAGWKVAALAIFVIVLSFFTVLLLLYAISHYASWLFGV